MTNTFERNQNSENQTTAEASQLQDWGIEIHEVVHLFPAMQEQEFEELKQDIRKNGQQMPILTHQNKVVDGFHRLRVCKELGIVPWYEEMDAANDAEVKSKVISLNIVRRNYEPSVRAMLAARLTNSGIGTNQHTAGAVSQQKVANELGISVDSVSRGKQVLKSGVPELIKAVEAGKIDITNAATLAKLSKEDQSQLNFDDIKAIQEASKAINKAKFEARRQERLQEIEAKRANNKPLGASLGNFSVIYCDPPWNYMGELAVGYPCMSVQEICDMPISEICADDAEPQGKGWAGWGNECTQQNDSNHAAEITE